MNASLDYTSTNNSNPNELALPPECPRSNANELALPPGHPGVWRYFNQISNSERNNYQAIVDSLNTIERILSNIVEHPTEEKYRRLKMHGQMYLKYIAGVSGAQDLFIKWLDAKIGVHKFQEYLLLDKCNLSRFPETLAACRKRRIEVIKYRQNEALKDQIAKQQEEAHKLRVLTQIDNDKRERLENKN